MKDEQGKKGPERQGCLRGKDGKPSYKKDKLAGGEGNKGLKKVEEKAQKKSGERS